MRKFDIKSIIESNISIDVGLLNEASFSKSKLQKVSDLLAVVLGNSFGGEFKLLGAGLGFESFKKKGLGQGAGYRYINKKGFMIRFGWLKKDKKSKYQINVVDLWEPGTGAKWDTPSTTVHLAKWINIVDTVQELKDVLVTGMVTESKEDEKIPLLEAANPPKKMIAYGAAKGIEWNGESIYQYSKKIADAGLWDEEEYRGYKITKNQKEQSSSEDVFKENEQKLKAQKFSDPDLVFDDIEKLTKIVATGGANGLIVAGAPGLGKTHHVEATMKNLFGSPKGAEARWRHMKGGKLSAYGLYMMMFLNRDNKTLVFDDTDIWGDKDCVAMMKSAIDTYPVRDISWTSKATVNTDLMDAEERETYYEELMIAIKENPEDLGGKIKLPASFEFTSRVIFITNVPAAKFAKDPHMAAIMSRSFFVDVNLRAEDVVRRIKTILPFIEPDVSMDIKLEVVDALAKKEGQLTMRAVTKAIAIRMGEPSADWDRLVQEYA